MIEFDESTIETLLADYFSGSLDDRQTALVEEWISSSDENRRIAVQIGKLEQAASRIGVEETLDIESSLHSLHSDIVRTKRHSFFRAVQRVAAFAALPLAGLLFWYAKQYYAPSELQLTEVRTTTGMTSYTILPDGTEVWLNSNSKLSYPVSFSSATRTVSLEGEGYFKVTRQNGRKFVVNVQGVQIEVLGTEFDVESYPDVYPEVRTSLLSGKIRMKYGNETTGTGELDMNPGDSFLYSSKSGSVKKVQIDPAIASAWKDGRIVLNNTPLVEALRMVGNRYNVEFLVKNDRLLTNCYTGSFTNQRLEVVLEHFKRTTNINFDVDLTSLDNDPRIGRQIIIVN